MWHHGFCIIWNKHGVSAQRTVPPINVPTSQALSFTSLRKRHAAAGSPGGSHLSTPSGKDSSMSSSHGAPKGSRGGPTPLLVCLARH